MNSKSVKESDLGSISYTAVAFDCKECHKTESLWNYTTTDHKEGEQLEDRRKVGKSSCNFGDGTDQRVHYLMFMVVMMMQLTVDWGRPRHAAGYVVFLPRFEWETSRLGIWSCTAGYKFLGCWDLAAQHACCSVCCVWGAFTNLRKKKWLLTSSCPSVSTEQLVSHRPYFHENLIFPYFSKICRENPSFIKIGEE